MMVNDNARESRACMILFFVGHELHWWFCKLKDIFGVVSRSLVCSPTCFAVGGYLG